MRALLQRVSEAAVSVADREIARIDRGLLVFVAVFHDDTESTAQRLAERTLAARVFPDGAKAMNRSVLDIGGSVLAVSQFTLAADTRRSNRPSFGPAAPPAVAQELYDRYVEALREGCPNVAAGQFGADCRCRWSTTAP